MLAREPWGSSGKGRPRERPARSSGMGTCSVCPRNAWPGDQRAGEGGARGRGRQGTAHVGPPHHSKDPGLCLKNDARSRRRAGRTSVCKGLSASVQRGQRDQGQDTEAVRRLTSSRESMAARTRPARRLSGQCSEVRPGLKAGLTGFAGKGLRG